MMYIRTENEKGTITFTPLNDDAIYVLCEKCGMMVLVNNPGEIIWEVGSFKTLSICEKCYNEENS